MVIIVDASGLTFKAHNEVWKGDREHIRNTIWGEKYKNIVTETIKESDALKELQHKIAQEELQRTTESESDELFQKLVDNDRNFANLLSGRTPRVRLPSAGGEGGEESGSGEFDGKFSPTFLRLEERIKNSGVDIPINRTRPIAARTDAENGYLGRADNRGAIIIDSSIRDRFTIREHLHNGRLTVYMEPSEEALEIGETFKFKIGLQDPAMPMPVETEEIVVRIVENEKEQRNKAKDKKEPKAGDGDSKNQGKGKNAPTLGLPTYKLMTQDGREISGKTTLSWEDGPEGFDENDGGYAEDLGEGVVYYINYDNSYHLNYRRQQRTDISKEAVTEKYILGMRIMMLGFEQSIKALQENGKSSDDEIAEHLDQFRRMAAKGSSATVLALAENLPKIIDASSIQGEDE